HSATTSMAIGDQAPGRARARGGVAMVGDGSSGGGDGSPEGLSRKKRFRQSWVFRATLIFVAINMLGVIALASRGSARPDSCGGGFSGYSGGGGCVSDLNVKSFDAPDPVQVKNRLYYLA